MAIEKHSSVPLRILSWGPICFSGQEETEAPKGSVFAGNAPNPTACAGNVGLDKVNERYFLLSTGLAPVHLFNSEVLEQ